MDSVTSTEDLLVEMKTSQENILLDMIMELCGEDKLTAKLKAKVTRIISDCDLTHHTSLHKLTTTDDTTSTLLGFMHQTSEELTFNEQTELNQSIIHKIQNTIPTLNVELDNIGQLINTKQSHKDKIKELQECIDNKLDTIEEQENEKVELMMQWLNHRVRDVTGFSDDSSQLLTLKTRILELKSKILHLRILQNIFTETNQSIRAYSEIHKDLMDSIKETEERIQKFKAIINSDLY